MNDVLEKLQEVAKKEGFALEVKVQQVFEANNFTAEQNFRNEPGSPIDVFACRFGGGEASVFITECKGSSADSHLLLFGNTVECIAIEPKMNKGINFRSLARLTCESDGAIANYQPDATFQKCIFLRNDDQWPTGMRHAYSGDFRKGNDCKKLPRNDEKNNVYKGVSQLLDDLSHLKNTLSLLAKKREALNQVIIEPLKIIPLIVTNASIFIKENDREEIIKVKWAVYSTAGVTKREGKLANYIFIVSVDALDEFIRLFG